MEKLRLRSQETVKRSIVNYTKMPPYCFEDCTSLTSITIPKSVTEVSNGYFKGCTSLKEVTCLAQVPPLGLGSFDNPRKITLSLYKAYSSRNVSQEKMKNPVSSLCKRTYGIYIVPRLGGANTELEQMIMYLETFRIIYYRLIINMLRIS